MDEAKRWLAQAALDLKIAEDTAEAHPSAACFYSQQAAEKATKAFSIVETGSYKRTHDIMETMEAVPALQALISFQDATLLDSFYTSTRYPDAWPGGIPGKRFTTDQARDAIAKASQIVGACAKVIAEMESSD